MALKGLSLFLYGYTVDITNQFIDFQNTFGGPVLTATIPSASYNLGDYCDAVASAFTAADPSQVYTVTADRTIAGGTQNRITVTSNGTYFAILFSSGGHAAASAATTMGFNTADYTGALTYTGAVTTGTAVIPVMPGYNWTSPNRLHKVFGSVNVSAVGIKESIVFQIQRFFEVQFKYEPESIVDSVWQPFLDWAIQQQDFEFTPEISQPTLFYPCTLEGTEEDSQGLGFRMPEMLPDFPGLHETGKLVMRQNIKVSEFL